MTDLEQAVTALRQAPEVAVTAHIAPEGDAVGSLLGAVLALRAAGKTAQGYLPDPVPPGLRALPGAGEILRQVPIGRPYPCYLVLDTADLRHAHVLFTCGADARVRAEALTGLVSASGFLRGELGRGLHLRYAPELAFELDESVDYSLHIAALLKQVGEQERERD